MKVTLKPLVTGAFDTVRKGLLQGLEDSEIRGTGGDYPNYCIIKIGQNTEKSPGDFKRLAITQTP